MVSCAGGQNPPRRRKYQRTGNGMPPTQRQWRKRDRGALNLTPPTNRTISQRISPEEQHLSTGNLSCCTVPPQNFHRSTFSFSESRTAVFFSLKRKSGFGPSWAGKKQLQGKNTPLSCKRKSGFTRRGYVPRSSQNACPFSALKERLGVPPSSPPKETPVL